MPPASAETLVFSYGSNSVRQLRQRLRNPALTSTPATLPSYSRVFCLSSSNWAGGGVASLAPSPPNAAPAQGSVVSLTPDELARLDEFEHGYRRASLTAVVSGAPAPVIAYIAGAGGPADRKAWTPPMTVRPSEMYLTAVRLHLRDAWGAGAGDVVEVASFEDGVVVRKGAWEYPGAGGLGAEALLLESNWVSRKPWVDGGKERKTRLVDTAAAMRKAGLGGAREVLDAGKDGVNGINERMEGKGEEAIEEAMVEALLEVCGRDAK